MAEIGAVRMPEVHDVYFRTAIEESLDVSDQLGRHVHVRQAK
jgi:hypothetical protein